MMHPYGGTPICPRCSKAVYAAEQTMGPGRKLYHKPCLACSECNKRLDSFSLVEHDQEPYCKNCHTKLFGTRDLRQANLPHRPSTPTSTGTAPLSPTRTGNSFTSNHSNSSPGSFSPTHGHSNSTPPTLPPRRVTSPGPSPVGTGRVNTGGSFSLRPTHTLTSPASGSFERTRSPPPLPPRFGTVVEEMDGEPEVVVEEEEEEEEEEKEAHEMNGHVEEREGPEAAVDDMLQNAPSSDPPNIAQDEAEESNVYHYVPQPSPPTPAPALPNRPTPATMGRAGLGGTMSLNLNNGGAATIGRTGSMSGMMPLKSTPTGTRYGIGLTGAKPLKASPTGGKWGGETPKCPKCGKSVYFAEQVKAVGKTWHKGCLRCGECGTTLDSTRLTEKDGEPFCHRCYSKLHGPRGGGYALMGKAGG